MHATNAPLPPPPGPAANTEPGVQADPGVRGRTWWRIGVAAVVAGQSMAASLAVNLTPPEGTAYWIVHGVLLAAALAVCALLLPPLVREATAALRAGRVTVEFLFGVTLLGALAASVTASLTHTGAVYYEVVSILLAVYAAGKTLGARSRARALRTVEVLRERFDAAERIDGPVVPAAALCCGERVRIRPGGAIAVDGVVRAGRSFVQEAAMTGEWRPLSRGPGDRVFAGTHALDGELEVEVTAPAGERRLDGVLQAVGAARLAPSELQRQADRLTAGFLPAVVAVSAGTFVYWTAQSGWVTGLFNSMAVLLVACPCALGLATPLAVWQGLAQLAELGLVARTGDVLDGLARADFVCFDKTGTLSEAQLAVKAWRVEPGFCGREEWLQAAVAAVEWGLPHPVARALAGESAGGARPAVGDLCLVPGRGVQAQVDGAEMRIGAPDWIGVEDTAGGRTVAVAYAGRLAARIELAETWRAGAGEAMAELARLGIGAEVLTGDSAWAGEGLAPAAIRTGLTPAAKYARVEALRRAGHVVAFVGDGINDAAAMGAATTAIAMAGGAPLAQAAAPAVFLGGDLRFLPAAIRLARQVRAGVATNLRFAAGYNALGMVLAATGCLHPVVAALLMLGSSAFVSVRALRRR